jgi:uncharacterized protein
MLIAPAILADFVPLLLMLGLAAFLAAAAIVWAMARAMLRPPRMSDAKAVFFLHRLSPQDLDLPYESLWFPVRDQRKKGRTLKLAAWWIPAAESSDRCAILVHGYTDAKVGVIAWAPLLRSMGFHVLAIDLRAHGESEGEFSTAGFYERHDLAQVIDQIKADRPACTHRMVLMGASLGAAVVSATATMRSDLSAVILECPYVDFPSAVLSHGDNLPLPGRRFQRLALWLAERLVHVDFGQVRPVELIGQIRCPIWVVQAAEDSFVPPSDQQAIADAVTSRPAGIGPSSVWQAPGSRHVLAMAADPTEYRRRLTDFLAQAMVQQTDLV